MTSRQFKKVYEKSLDLGIAGYNELEAHEAYRCLDGFGLPGVKCVCTVKQAAYVIRWQCLQLNGEYDSIELANTREAMMLNVTLLD